MNIIHYVNFTSQQEHIQCSPRQAFPFGEEIFELIPSVFSTSNEVSGFSLEEFCKCSGDQEGLTRFAEFTYFSATFPLETTNGPAMSYLLHKNLTVQTSPSMLSLAKMEVTFFIGVCRILCFRFQL